MLLSSDYYLFVDTVGAVLHAMHLSPLGDKDVLNDFLLLSRHDRRLNRGLTLILSNIMKSRAHFFI